MHEWPKALGTVTSGGDDSAWIPHMSLAFSLGVDDGKESQWYFLQQVNDTERQPKTQWSPFPYLEFLTLEGVRGQNRGQSLALISATHFIILKSEEPIVKKLCVTLCECHTYRGLQVTTNPCPSEIWGEFFSWIVLEEWQRHPIASFLITKEEGLKHKKKKNC